MIGFNVCKVGGNNSKIQSETLDWQRFFECGNNGWMALKESTSAGCWFFILNLRIELCDTNEVSFHSIM